MANIVDLELAVRMATMEVAPVGSIPIKLDSPGRLYGHIMASELGGGGGLGHLAVEFTFADVINGFKSIGQCPSGKVLLNCALEISEPFDGGLQVSVGHDDAMGLLMTSDDIVANYAALYESQCLERNLSNKTIKVFFPTGNPTRGRGIAVLQLN
jgi:hypothetical protein